MSAAGGSGQNPAMTVTVRLAAADDLDALIALRTLVAREGVWIAAEFPLDEARDRRNHAASIVTGHATDGTERTAAMFVAEVDGVIVGSLGLQNPIGIAHLGMCVADGHRGHGVGHALMEAGIEWARAAGAHKVDLDLWPWNHRARALYERFGFVEEGYRRRHYRRRDGSLWDAVEMGLVLDDGAPGHEVGAVEPPRRPVR